VDNASGGGLTAQRRGQALSPPQIDQGNGSRSRFAREEAFTRVRHTLYGSQPDRGDSSLSSPSTRVVNSSLAAGLSRWPAGSPCASFLFIWLVLLLAFHVLAPFHCAM
jgi:hypothetical protein